MDKARRTYTVPLSFSDGEVPPAAKLTALSSQARRGLQVLERIVGDPWNQSGDAVLSPGADPSLNALHIPNLARAIGDLALINPRDFLPGTTDSYTDAIGARYPLRHIAYLRFPPLNAPAAGEFTFAGNGEAFAAGGFQSNPNAIDADGEWSIDSSGKVYSYTPIPSATTVTYEPNIEIASNLRSGTWNIIPDPSTWAGSFAGLKIIYTNGIDGTGGYTLYLPPRQPLGSSRDTTMAPSSSVENLGTAGGALAYWGTGDATTAGTHYRYQLPTAITGLVAGTVLPEGFLYLWDETSGTIVEGLAFDVASASAAVRVDVTGTELDNLFGGEIADGGHVSTAANEAPAAYRSRWKLIVHGTSLAQHVDSITARFLDHQHRAGDSPPISHGDLEGLVSLAQSATGLASGYPAGVAIFPPASNWGEDHHTQYLHRTGSTGSSTTRRDYLDNAMTGDLLMAADTNSEGWLNLTQNSNRIRFGVASSGPYIGWAGNGTNLRGLDIEAGPAEPSATDTTASYVIIRRGKLWFGAANAGSLSNRGQLHYDNHSVFKLSTSVAGDEPTVARSILALGQLVVHPQNTTGVWTTPDQVLSAGNTPRLILQSFTAVPPAVVEMTSRGAILQISTDSTYVLRLRTTGSSNPRTRLRLETDEELLADGRDLRELTNGGYARDSTGSRAVFPSDGTDAGTGTENTQLHTHSIWAVGGATGIRDPGVANKLGIVTGEILYDGSTTGTTSITKIHTIRFTYANEAAGTALTVTTSAPEFVAADLSYTGFGTFIDNGAIQFAARPAVAVWVTGDDADVPGASISLPAAVGDNPTTHFDIDIGPTGTLVLERTRIHFLAIGPVTSSLHDG